MVFEGIRMVKNGCFVTVQMFEVTEENCDTSYHKLDIIEHLQSSTTDMSQELPASTIQPDKAISFNILSFIHVNTISQTIRCNSLYDISIFGNK